MSSQNLSTLSDIREEQSASVSLDSLENADEKFQGISQKDDTVDSLNCTQDTNDDSPSFHNILSSSYCDASPNFKPGTSVSNVKISHHVTVAALFACEDVFEVHTKSDAIQKYVEDLKRDTTEIFDCKKSDVVTECLASSTTSKDECTPALPPKTISKSEARRANNKVKVEHDSKIPVPVRSSPIIAKLKQSVEKHSQLNTANTVVSTSSPQPTTEPPKAAERCRSHHTIERPKKDFIQLNKQGEFRRTKTYHSLHLERRDGQKTADGVTATPSSAGGTDPPSTTADHGSGSTADLAPPTRESPLTPGRSPGPGSSPRGSDVSSPAAGSGGSGGRRSSRIPVRTGPAAASRRRHQSHESPRSHASRHEGHVSRHDHHVSRHDQHVSRQDGHVFRREPNESRFEFHESRLSYGSSESELLVPRLQLPHSQLSLIDVNDNRRLLSDVSAPSLLNHQYHGSNSRNRELVILDDNVSSLSLQLPGARKPFMPPERTPPPHRHVEYQPNLKPYPRQYINLGRLGPDPDTVRARQEKMQKQQAYAERVAKKNRSVVKQMSHQYSAKQQAEQSRSAHEKMVNYAKTVPKPKTKPQPSTSPRESREVSPMSKIRKLLSESSLPNNDARSGKSPTRSNGSSPTRSSVLSPKQPPGISILPSEVVTSAKPPPAGRPVVARRHSVSVPEPRPPPLPLPTFEAPKTSALPPRDTRRRPRRQPNRSASLGQARVAHSLSRMQSLTDQLVTGAPATETVNEATRRLRRDDSCPTLGASSDMDSDYSTDSLIAASRPPVVSMGRSHGSSSPRGRGLFPPARGAPNCRRPTVRCSRGVGPDRLGAASHPVAEDFFYDTCGGHGECACGDDSCSPPLSPHRRPAVTRGTQSTPTLNDTFVVHKNPLVVDIGMPVGVGRARRFSPRSRLRDLSPDSLVGSPPKDSRTCRPDGLHSQALQMMRERHLRDKRRVDAIISDSITRM